MAMMPPTMMAPPAAMPAMPPRTGLMMDDPFADDAALRARITDRLDKWKKGREMKMRTAWRNLLFYLGHQWIVWSVRLGSWRPATLKRSVPRPVSNHYAATMDAYNSVLARVEPVLLFRPATDEPEDQAAADVAQRCMRVIEQEVGLRLQRQILATWCGFTGSAWMELGYDPSPEHGTRLIQDEECPGCGLRQPPTEAGMCATCGGPTMPAMDAEGQPMGQTVPIGRLFTAVRSCFEVFFDPALSTGNWRDVRECLTRRSLSLDEAKRRYPDVAESIVSDAGANPGELYLEQLPTMAGHLDQLDGAWNQVAPFARTIAGHRVTETCYRTLPDAQFPEGAYLIMLGANQIVYKGPLPYWIERPDGDNEYLLGMIHFPTKLAAGSIWSKAVADDLALLQVQRNELESQIIATQKRMGNPVWLLPEGSNPTTTFTGEPGQVVTYNALGPNPRPPERIPGQPVPTGFITYLQMKHQEFDELAATYDIVKGNRPAGVSAGVALQMLEEKSKSRFGSLFILWEQAWAEWARQAIAIFRQFATEPRLLRVQGKNGAWEIEKFLGADLTGQIDIVPEAGSGLPKSTLVERATFEQGANLGLIDLRDPEIRRKGRDLFDMGDLTPGMRDDTKNAIMQTEQFAAFGADPATAALLDQVMQAVDTVNQQMAAQGGAAVTYADVQQQLAQMGLRVPRVRPSVDGHAIFAQELGDWLKSASAQALPESVQRLAEMKQAEHLRLFQESQNPPLPKVAVNLRGDLAPEVAATLAGAPPPAAAPPVASTGGSSLLHTPPIVSTRPRSQTGRPSPMAAGGSGARVLGDMREMSQRA